MGEMGERLIGNLVMITKDGRKIEFENAEITELSAESDVIENDDTLTDFSSNRVVKNSYEVSLQIKNITKKRFIKLLMSKGIARNGAKDIASYVYKKYGYYNVMFMILI